MKDYGNLRHRTRDSSWQWLLMGTILGVGFAMVLCVGGYAIGAISFPALEDETPTPRVQIEPNQTEVAMQALAAQQTLEAAQQVLPDDTQSPPAADETPADAMTNDQAALSTPTPSPLPVSPAAEDGAQPDQPAPAAAEGTLSPEEAATQTVAAMARDTPVVGTPPVGQPTQTIGLPGPPAIPPELDAIKTELATITGGTFMMGTTLEEATRAMDECALYGKTCDNMAWVSDSTPTHQTTVDSFQMEIYEVSIQQYVTFLNWLGPDSHKARCQGQVCAVTILEQENSYIAFDGTTYSVRNPDFANHPMTYVTWWGAQEYCQTLNRRLPTEAEWERAARGSQNYVYPWGFEFDSNRAMSSIAADKGIVARDSYAAGVSPYGVYNMAGNVSEWVFDWYQADYYAQMVNNPQPNPKGPISGTEKIHRGGNWDTIPLFLRSVHRLSAAPDSPTAAIGFRCVADMNAAATQPAAQPNTSSSGDTTGSAPVGAPTLAPPPTQPPSPTRTPALPPATLAPG